MLYIYTHKDFKCKVNGEEYTILSSKELNDKYDLPLINLNHDNGILHWGGINNELKCFDFLYSNNTDSIIGLDHYRKYFRIKEEEIKEILKQPSTIIVPDLIWDGSLKQQFDKYHNPNDLNEIVEIILKFYPYYQETISSTLNTKPYFFWNMFIMNNKDFKEYYIFLKKILTEYNKKHNFETEDDVTKYVIENINNYPSTACKTINYQNRLQGFLSERIFNIYVRQNFSNIINKHVQHYNK